MKRCPKCSRTFPDDNQKFCTIDGGLLVPGDRPFDPNATIQGSANSAVPLAPSQEQPVDFDETIAASAPTVVFPKTTGPTGLPTSSNLPPQPPAPTPRAPTASTPAPSAPVASTPSQPAAPPPTQGAPLPAAQRAPAPPVAGVPPVAKKKSKLPLILGILALLLILGAGAVVAGFFLVIKPRLDRRNSEPPVVVSENPAENVNSSPGSNTNASEPTPEPEKTQPEYVAPPDTTKFTNSQANLEGKLAEHYFDFSFYHPNNWLADPKAGGASGNFVKFERRLPPDFTQENFAVRYYESKGTYEADLPDFPRLVEEFSASLAKVLPGYHIESEGPTKINSLDAYEFRYVGLSKGTERGDLKLWGRVVFVPTGKAGDSNGAVLTMFTTSLAPELSSVADVGSVGEMPVILDSFRFGKSP
ncbi:MAG: hypothetical protein ACRD9S_11325 [Pyrinomonadaceae bacterium]